MSIKEKKKWREPLSIRKKADGESDDRFGELELGAKRGTEDECGEFGDGNEEFGSAEHEADFGEFSEECGGGG